MPETSRRRASPVTYSQRKVEAVADAAPKARLAWPDAAKGLSIVGVVLLHICLAVPGGEQSEWFAVNAWIAPLRMPLFFMVSGYFSVKVFRFTFAELWTRRLWFLSVPYLLWVPVELWTKNAEWHRFLGQPWPTTRYYVESLLFSTNMYWFLHSLVLFTVVLWCTKRCPDVVRWLLLFGFVLAIRFVPPVDHEGVQSLLTKLLQYLPCFLAGAYARPAITRLAASPGNPTSIALAALSYLAAEFVDHFLYAFESSPPTVTQLHTMALLMRLPGAILLVVWLTKVPWLSGLLQRLGRHTLVIYLSHPLAITLGFSMLFAHREGGIALESDSLFGTTWWWVLVCMPLAVLGGLCLHWMAKVPVLGWAVTPPPLVHTTKTKDRKSVV